MRHSIPDSFCAAKKFIADRASVTLRNYDGDGKENVKKTIGLMSNTTTLHVYYAFLSISLLSLHNYDVK